MESRSFSEVFGNIKIKDDIADFFEKVTVERVIFNRSKHAVKVYISYDCLIPKEYILRLERELSRKLMVGENFDVKILEKYTLSSQYTKEIWLDSYKDSIALELSEYDLVLHTIFRSSNIKFNEEGKLVISIPDSKIARMKRNSLEDIIGRIANERFGFDFDVVSEMTEPVKSKFKIENELRAQRMVDEIARSVKHENDVTNAEDTAVVEAPVKESQPAAKKEEPSKPSKYSGKSLDSFTRSKNSSKPEFSRSLRKSDNPNLIYNKEFEGDAVKLEDVQDELGEIIVEGKILQIEERFLEKSGKTIYKFEISDYTDSIKLKLFLNEEFTEEIRPLAKVGDYIKAKGVVTFDTFDKELEMGSIFGIMKSQDHRKKREDLWSRKRVELHCHTKMSDMDGVSDVTDIVKQVKKFGHPALAITDHGVLQSFPAANHAVSPDEDFKIIYGVEGYLVNDLKTVVVNSKHQTFNNSYVFVSIHTTGYSCEKDKILEIGAVKMDINGSSCKFSKYVNPRIPIPMRMERITGINDAMVKDAEPIETVLPEFIEFAEDSVIVAHNADFVMDFIKAAAAQLGITKDYTYIDSMRLSQVMCPQHKKHDLEACCKNMNIDCSNFAKASDKAEITRVLFFKLQKMLLDNGITKLDEINDYGKQNKEAIAKLKSYHVIILAKNEIGRRNLYKLVSMSNLEYYSRFPKMPKSKVMELREGLIIGSACEAGELYTALVSGVSNAELADIVNFYDYLEIQPIANNAYQIEKESFPDIESEEDLRDMNRRIVELGEFYNKPVCATCDVHFLNPEDSVYREIIMASKDMNERPVPLYLRTTEEMLEEFAYLGTIKAEEVVIDNTNLIANMCEKITPVRPDKCPPVIENSEEDLRRICYTKAHEMYGEELPKVVNDRLERELNSIIGNGYAVMYIIAQKLVWKSVEDGYLVGSRGSVGSSFAATMSGITEVNPLSPHYYCSKCHYVEFDSEEVKKFAGMAGCDMPDKVCPNCGEMLKKDGFDIPFETFLGFKGDKEPDIDLNFSGEYQSKAHKYTEVIFGYGQTFKAGTIGTLADKTAYGMVKHFFEDMGKPKRPGEIDRIVQGCVGVRRTTGQHPGGIVVLPVGDDINSFTAVQHPADKTDVDIITTHFDYHSIDHNLLKLDILGHDDPTMIRMLQDLTGLDPVTIPLDDKAVMSLFQNTSALGVEPEDLRGCKLGSLGIPEFGTPFAMQMLIDTKPQYFSDLVRIAGLSHGTDVWLGNAETLIKEGTATISTAICTRDDIMVYLIGMGLDPAMAFSIMENVRKGKVAKGKCDKWPGWKDEMRAHGVPEWYIGSCEKIQYMFPKAHAAAYVMMAWRIAYYKINYPLAYYCAFFSIRANAFDYSIMCMGRSVLEEAMDKIEKSIAEKTNSPKDEEAIKTMRIVQEMYARGFEFMKLDLYKAKAKAFQIIDGKIMPSFTSLDKLGEACAMLIEDEARKGQFFSKDDLKERGKVPQSVMDVMSELGILDGMTQSSQLSIFDFQ